MIFRRIPPLKRGEQEELTDIKMNFLRITPIEIEPVM
jgi:hypothetical protein